MPEFKKGGGWSGKFLSKSPYKKETRWEGPKTKDTKADGAINESKMKDSGKLYPKMKDPSKLYPKMKPSHLKATIAKDAGIPPIEGEKKEKKMKTRSKEWQPAFPGADHSREELDKMTKKEKEDYYN
tara:strand:+ start:899 stop:1279 length:381 start_codon:yes stop_codon:yes gene_type:complete